MKTSSAGASSTVRLFTTWLFVAFALPQLHVGDAQDPSCAGRMIQQLNACAPFVSPSPNAASQPSPACCSSLQNADLSCMCQVLNGPSIPTLDRTKALSLPQACSLSASITCN
ncbi:hypothetical protein KP509_07G064700 [Ceratopteris richardii]|uniref:Bifunctional inhibitor/plant lipid transfer protein/seed storage helical domain-containing protein n=1 Tax=Ceratopteris richardii TaxID=49495 RepID=A0A8T2UJ22_CERRI|nr:hypothetical protein KP509_07G064700 [Ceratopteris richardii]